MNTQTDRTKRAWQRMVAYYRSQVCQAWLSYSKFLVDMGECPLGARLRRKDSRKGTAYSPDNCYWYTPPVPNGHQGERFITVNGETRTIAEWGERTGLTVSQIINRFKHKWTEEEAVTIPPNGWRSKDR